VLPAGSVPRVLALPRRHVPAGSPARSTASSGSRGHRHDPADRLRRLHRHALRAALLARGERVLGVDNLNAYYDVALKQARLQRLLQHPGFAFERLDVADRGALRALFARVRPTRVLHLAAQAGVRYSIDAPDDYTDANLLGFANVLQGCRKQQVAHLVLPAVQRLRRQHQMPFARARRGGPPHQLLRSHQEGQRADGA
jgi:NAD(P)-dependent dehydrogenase (short-subunit alcohol dehydrogenase family)